MDALEPDDMNCGSTVGREAVNSCKIHKSARPIVIHHLCIWEKLCMLTSQFFGEKWIVLGNFNEVLYVGERVVPGEYSDIGPSEFRGILEQIELLEMETKEGFFTWTNGVVGQARQESRNDRVIVNETWMNN